jgi:hypothetical protein
LDPDNITVSSEEWARKGLLEELEAQEKENKLG